MLQARLSSVTSLCPYLVQVAALRTIGSQTHPAIQQMLLAHEQQLGELQVGTFSVEGMIKSPVADQYAATMLKRMYPATHLAFLDDPRLL